MTKLIKNILKGASTVFDINPPPRRTSLEKHYKPHKTDAAALRSDWQKIGGDFNKALKRVVNSGE